MRLNHGRRPANLVDGLARSRLWRFGWSFRRAMSGHLQSARGGRLRRSRLRMRNTQPHRKKPKRQKQTAQR